MAVQMVSKPIGHSRSGTNNGTRSRRLVAASAVWLLVLSLVGLSASPAAAQDTQFTLFDDAGTQTRNTYHVTTLNQPADYTSPVDYVNGRAYARLEVTDKPSSLLAYGQVCLWRHTEAGQFAEETCAPRSEFTDEGVVWMDLGRPGSWWKKDGAFPWDSPVSISRFMIFDAASRKLLMDGKCGAACYPRNDLEDHIPISIDGQVIFVANGAELAPPADWVGECPEAWTDACAGVVEPVNQAPVVSAGPDQSVTSEGPVDVSLAGTATDDQFTPESVLTSTWTGPAGVSFADPASPTTTVTLPGPGEYELTLTGDDGELSSSDSVIVTVIDPNAPQPIEVLMVTKQSNGTFHDRLIRDLLEAEGYVVTIADDNAVQPADTAAYDIVYVSSTTAPAALKARLADITVPVVNAKAALHDDFGMALGGVGETSGMKDIIVVDSGHPTAAGATGTTRVLTGNSRVGWGRVGGDAEVVATITNRADRATLFTYPEGFTLANGEVAPANRAGFFLTAASDNKMTEQAKQMLFATLAWATGDAPPAPNRAPEVSAGSDVEVSSTDPVTVPISATVSDDGKPEGQPVTTTWTGPADVVFADANAASTDVTLPGPGVYTLTVEASDSELSTSDSVVVTVIDPNAPVFEPTQVLMVTSTAKGSTHDRLVASSIEAATSDNPAGIEVQIVDDNAVTLADADAADAVLIGATASPSVIKKKLNDTSTPILSYEVYLFDDLGLTVNAGAKRGEVGSFTEVDVVAAHPIVDGYSGVTPVYTSASKLTWGVPAADAEVLATLPTRTDRATLFVYEAGDTLANGEVAPGIRIGLFPNTAGDSRLNGTGLGLIVSAIDWSVS